MTNEEILNASQIYQALIGKILNHFAGDAFNEEVRFAKGEFFDNAGILEEQSEQFELRMSQFFDWYLFTRELRGYSEPPRVCLYRARITICARGNCFNR